jgi:hypothetical protein
VIFQNEPIFSWFFGEGVFRGLEFIFIKAVSRGRADEHSGEFVD